MKFLLLAYRILDTRERGQAWIILAVVTIMALFDTLGTVSIMPFLAVVADPVLVERNPILSWIQTASGFASGQEFLIFLGACSFALLIISASVRTLGQYLVNRFTTARGHTIGTRLLETYLRQPYVFFLHRHSGDMAKDLLTEILLLVTQVYQPATVLVAQSILLMVILSVMIAVNPSVALIGMGVLGICYGVIYFMTRSGSSRAGRERAATNQHRSRIATEALGGIKIVKLLGQERHYLELFDRVTARMVHLQATNQTLAIVPRYTIEAIAFGGIILLTLVLMVRYETSESGPMAHILPFLAFYAFSGYRILPAVQGIFQALTQLRFGAPALESIAADLSARETLAELPAERAPQMGFVDRITLQDLGFRYPQAERASVEGVSLSIPAGSSLGIVGSTGAGKTTLVDLFLGLLTPTSGEIRVDDQPVTAQTLRNWQSNLGYVPQDIFLMDASVAQNIALGVKKRDVDMDRVREAARMAQILDFIETEMPQGFETAVGERGVRLSGGQRQRIGIARALYRNPGVIVFDEATSALDNLTEQEVVKAINAIAGQKTLILIAHRISTVQNCDQILVLRNGQIAGVGRYDDLYAHNEIFRALVEAREVG